MQELSPDEYKDILDENGEIAPPYLSSKERETLNLVKILQHARCDSAMRCFFCKGTMFFPIGSNFKCVHCNGKGWK